MYENYMKRIIDFLLSLVTLIFLTPFLIVIAVSIYLKLGAPILFKQRRPGKNQKIFVILKFRTMTSERDNTGRLLPDDIRFTSFGKFLRSTSIDELPELINILKGDMSIVGPRPLLVQYLPYYSDEQRHRHDVRPGLTGLAQVNGRNALSWEEKFKFDVEYVRNITFFGDCKIILQTAMKVIQRENISSKTSITMEEFKGGR